jgi:hypothetical protein
VIVHLGTWEAGPGEWHAAVRGEPATEVTAGTRPEVIRRGIAIALHFVAEQIAQGQWEAPGSVAFAVHTVPPPPVRPADGGAGEGQPPVRSLEDQR